MGQELKRHEEWMKRNKQMIILTALICFGVVGFIFPTSLGFVLNYLRQGNYFVNFVFSISACTLLWFLAQKIDNTIIGKSTSYLGRISLVVFAFHRPVLNWILQPAIMKIYPSVPYSVFLIICLIVLLFLSIAVEKILTTYIPKFIGK